MVKVSVQARETGDPRDFPQMKTTTGADVILAPIRRCGEIAPFRKRVWNFGAKRDSFRA